MTGVPQIVDDLLQRPRSPSWAKTGPPASRETASSLRLDPQLVDERQVFLGIGLYQSVARLRRLPLARGNVHAEIGDPGSNRRSRQRSHGRRIELADDILRRALWREKCEPAGV